MTATREPVSHLDVLSAITAHRAEFGVTPSTREIGARVGLSSTSSVEHHLRHLEELELIRRQPGKFRTIHVLETPRVEAVLDAQQVAYTLLWLTARGEMS